MTTRSIIWFYLRTSPGTFRFGAVPWLFFIPYFGYITARGASFEQVILMSFCAIMFSLVLFGSCLTIGGGQPPHAEFLVTRPVDRKRLWLIYVTMVQVLFLAPTLISLVLAFWYPDLRVWEFAGENGYASVLEKFASYQQSFPGSWIEHQTSSATLVMPDGRVLMVGCQIVTLIFFASAVQLFVLRHRKNPWLDKCLKWSVLGEAVLLAACIGVFGSKLVTVGEAFFLVFVRHWPLFCVSAIVVFVAVQVWSIRRVRDMEVL